MAIWDNWSQTKKTRALIGVLGFAGLFLYALFMDLTGQ